MLCCVQYVIVTHFLVLQDPAWLAVAKSFLMVEQQAMLVPHGECF